MFIPRLRYKFIIQLMYYIEREMTGWPTSIVEEADNDFINVREYLSL